MRTLIGTVTAAFLLFAACSRSGVVPPQPPQLPPPPPEAVVPAAPTPSAPLPASAAVLPKIRAVVDQGRFIHPAEFRTSFADEQYGWLESTPELRVTEDGGLHWRHLHSFDSPIDHMQLLSRNVGWVAAGEGLYATRDGGNTWRLLSRDDYRYGWFQFITEQIGWKHLHDQRLFQTTDGGKSWTAMPAPCDGKFHFADAHTGFGACGSGGGAGIGLLDIHRTDDGGKSWRMIATNGTAPDWKGNLPAGAYLWDMFFLDGNHGWLGDVKGGLRVTGDGGATWEQLPRLGYQVGSLQFFTPDRGYRVLTQQDQSVSVLLRTRDGGQKWEPVYPLVPVASANIKVISDDFWLAAGTVVEPGAILLRDGPDAKWRQVGTLPGPMPGQSVSAISFIDRQNGWASIWRGPLYSTADGGRTWRTVAPDQRSFTSMDFVDAATGYASEGSGGPLLRTRDGGLTFEVLLGAVNGSRFVSRDRGWTVSSGALTATMDGGATWQPVTPLPGTVREFDFLSDGTGVALAGNDRRALELYATPDGGKSWTWIDLGDVKPMRVKLLGTGRARVWDDVSRGYASEDGLRTWQRIQ